MKFILSMMMLLVAHIGYAQESLNLSLEEAISLALKKNASIKNSNLDIDIANTQVKEVRAQGLPQINGSLGYTHNLKIATQVLPDFISPSVYGVLFEEGIVAPKEIEIGTFPAQFGVPFSMNAAVGVNQLLFDGTFFLGLQAASEFVKISELSASASEIDVKQAVTKAYYLALISEQNIGQLNTSLDNINKLRTETETMYKAGYAEKLDIDRLVLAINNLELAVYKLKNQSALAKQLLLNSMGIDINQSITLSSKMPTNTSTAVENLGFNPSNRIEYKLLEQKQVLNELNLKRYKVGYFPSLYGNFMYGGNTFAGKDKIGDLGDEWYPISSYGFSLNVPVFDGFYKKQKTNQAQIEIAKTANSLQQAALGMSLQASQARIEFLNADKMVVIQKKNQELATSIYETTSIKFKEGVGSSFEMITAESELTKARTNYLNALYALNVAKINWDIALGTF